MFSVVPQERHLFGSFPFKTGTIIELISSVPFSPGASVSAKKWLTTRILRLYQGATGAGSIRKLQMLIAENRGAVPYFSGMTLS